MTLPNLLSLVRLLLSPVLLVLAWLGYADIFIGALILAFLLDLIDGPIARKFHQVSRLGPKLDSCADFFIYVSFLIGAYLLWPHIVKRELIFIILVGLSIILPALVGFLKFRKATSYHTWLVKCAAVTMAPGAILLFINGPTWPFYMATGISVLAALEEIAITLIIDTPQSDVGTLIHVLRNKKNTL